MSNATKQRNESPTESEADSLLDRFRQWYHIPVLLGLMVFMLATRLRALSNFQTSGGITFRGNDPWYHFRESSYLIEHFPWTMPFDPWTDYPTGTDVGQFGTLFDQIVVGFILLTSFGDPTPEYAGLIYLVAAPVFMVLAVVPAYLIAARFAGRGPALAGMVVLALLSGTFLNYSLVGFYDHHAGEVLFQTLGVLAFIVALGVAEREQPIWELVVDRDFAALRRPLLYSVAAGVAAALYMWVWPPGVLLVGFSGIFFAVKITSEVFHDQTPEPVAFVGAVSLSVTALLMAVRVTEFGFSTTRFSVLQVVLPLGVALGCLFLAALARQWEQRDLSVSTFPAAVGGLLVATMGVVSLILPGFLDSIRSDLLGTVGFSASAAAQTIGEATPPLQNQAAFEFIYSEYGLAFFTAMVAALIILGRPLYKSDNSRDTYYLAGSLTVVGLIYLANPIFETIAGIVGTEWQILGLLIASGLLVGATFLHRYDAAELYLLIWAAFITSAGFTQIRFNYYLSVVVAVFTAIFVAQVLDFIDFESTGDSVEESIRNLEGWQIMVALTALLMLTAPLLFPFAGSAWAAAGSDRNGPGAVTQWDDSLDWMSEETPYPGELEGADNRMEYYGTYERTDNFDYPEGAYGVQSWWDYGHWITVNGERIPNANPFQSGAGEAAEYLLAGSEQDAAAVMDEQMGEGDQTRYVMVDWEMVTPGAKFGAPTVFADDVSQEDFISQTYPIVQTEEGEQFGQPVTLRSQRYYDSQMIRLYNYHGSAADPEPIVIETEPRTVQTQAGEEVTVETFDQENDVQTFDTLEEAQAYVDENPGAQLGGLGAIPGERVDALEHYRLVKASESNALTARGYQQDLFTTAESTGIGFDDLAVRSQTGDFSGLGDNPLLDTDPHWVKTFERIPGATVSGSGAEPGEEISANVEMEIPETGETFTYTQYAEADSEGTFEMTLPYSSTGYDEFGPAEGYTNTTVQATGEYVFSSEPTTDEGLTTTQRIDQTHIEEGQVIGVDDSEVTVELTEQTVDEPEGAPADDAE